MKILMPCGLCAAIPAVKPTSSPQDNVLSYSNESGIKKLIRPSELPIYSFEDDYTKQSACMQKECPPSALEQNISKIRKSVQVAMSEYQHYTSVVSDTIDTGIEHSRSLLDYLREESNVMPRMGAIGIGGLAGLILGLRGRTFKRLVYSSTGALAIGALCYPKKAEEGVHIAKHYINVGYNFIYGVKPSDDRQPEITVSVGSKLGAPTSFSELVDFSVDTISTVATAVGSFAQNAYASLTNNKEEKQPTAKTDIKQD